MLDADKWTNNAIVIGQSPSPDRLTPALGIPPTSLRRPDDG